MGAAPGDECPECQEGEIVIRTNGATGEEFLGCNEYPDCDYTEEIVLWERRIGHVDAALFANVGDDSEHLATGE